jgi:hypothetical protein
MESSFERSKGVYKSKIPDIEQTLELIRMMKKKQEEGEEMKANYNLCDTIYAKAQVYFLIVSDSLFFLFPLPSTDSNSSLHKCCRLM